MTFLQKSVPANLETAVCRWLACRLVLCPQPFFLEFYKLSQVDMKLQYYTYDVRALTTGSLRFRADETFLARKLW
jgi:hypothetical protein